MKLEVEKELERQIVSRVRILIEDMEQVIEHCEREDRGIIDPETGHRIGASEDPAYDLLGRVRGAAGRRL